MPAIANGAGRAAVIMPYIEVVKVEGLIKGAVVNSLTPVSQPEAASQTQEAVVNGFHLSYCHQPCFHVLVVKNLRAASL
jgi:hypothetical protein